MIKYFLPYDIYERHKKVGANISPEDTVLDVGGELRRLSQFCNPKKITVANLKQSQEKSDLIIEKGKLPFKESSFSTVCAIDVLEHIPKSERQPFIKELVRVAQNKAVLSFPIGTDAHTKYEKNLKKHLEQKGMDVTYLNEHINLGLPKKEEIESIKVGKRKEISYSGNLKMNELLFKIFIFDPKIKLIRKIVYYLKLIFNFKTNAILYLLLSNKRFSDKVVRAYVVIYKK